MYCTLILLALKSITSLPQPPRIYETALQEAILVSEASSSSLIDTPIDSFTLSFSTLTHQSILKANTFLSSQNLTQGEILEQLAILRDISNLPSYFTLVENPPTSRGRVFSLGISDSPAVVRSLFMLHSPKQRNPSTTFRSRFDHPVYHTHSETNRQSPRRSLAHVEILVDNEVLTQEVDGRFLNSYEIALFKVKLLGVVGIASVLMFLLSQLIMALDLRFGKLDF